MRNLILIFLALVAGQALANNESGARAFNQLGTELPTPNVYRTASGAPGPQYWQQEVDYDIDVTLNERAKRITATETITYRNNSPDTLRYLWVQLDQNRFKADSIYRRTLTSTEDRVSFSGLRREQNYADNNYGYEINAVKTLRGDDLKYIINDTMMRIDLADPLETGDQVRFVIDFAFDITNEKAIGGRGGYEHFPETNTHTFFLAQWFPRLAAYTDYTGWQNKQFLGRGEFTLEFGDYDVAITVPADHIVSSTGELTNPRDVLTAEQRRRLDAVGTDKPTFIVTPEEALENEQEGTEAMSTWKFSASSVRDFAWSSSRKYIWDAMLFEQPGAEHERVLAMSFYPNEAEPIWSQYSTHAVIHTMDVYNRFAFDYPYPTAQSVNVWERGGMEYPMITFNGYRPHPSGDDDENENEDEDETGDSRAMADADEDPEGPTYSRRTKYGLIAIIIHEIGHIYFPMVVNSDERQWTWMDEGINSFLEYLATMEWEENYPAYGNYANVLDYITEYMTSPNQVPIMTNSESILQFGPNAYSKPTAALIVLRETVMGRELFDFALKQYSERWQFKRPTPADFFRTMEDASAVDLDWFWRGWFYTTDHVDVAITDVRRYRLLSKDPDIDNPKLREDWAEDFPPPPGEAGNRADGIELRLDRYPELNDFYNENDQFTVSNKDRNAFRSWVKKLEDWERTAYERAMAEDPLVYFVDFENVGGLVTPLPITITYEDGSVREHMIPAEIWRRNAEQITHYFFETKPIASISVDNKHQTADADYGNNRFPPRVERSRFEIYKSSSNRRNLMKDMMVELKGDDKTTEESGDVPLQQQ